MKLHWIKWQCPDCGYLNWTATVVDKPQGHGQCRNQACKRHVKLSEVENLFDADLQGS